MAWHFYITGLKGIMISNTIGAFVDPQLFNAGIGVLAGGIVLVLILSIKRALK